MHLSEPAEQLPTALGDLARIRRGAPAAAGIVAGSVRCGCAFAAVAAGITEIVTASRPRKYGCVDVACDSVLHYREQEPDDVLPPYTRDRLAAMNDKFVRRLERAFKSGRERRASAASHMGERRMAPIALTDDQLVTLRQFATPIPPSLRDAFLRSVARRLAAIEVGDGAVHAACAAAQREVIDGARASE